MSTGPQPEPATHLLLGRPILQQVTAHLQAWRPQVDGRRFVVVRFEASPDAGEDWRQRRDASAVSARAKLAAARAVG